MKIYTDMMQFIDYLVNAISNGKYIYYQVTYVPENKADNEGFINGLDKRLSSKYNANLTKGERLTLRRNEKARFLYVRWNNIIVILKTLGDTDIAVNEKWIDIRKKKLELRISKYTTYLIGQGASKPSAKGDKLFKGRIEVTISKETYNSIKLSCLEAIRIQKSIPKLMYEWNKINGFNGWSGINKQKQQLKRYLVNEVRKTFNLDSKKASKLFRINTYKAKCIKAKKPLDQLENRAIDTTPTAPKEQEL